MTAADVIVFMTDGNPTTFGNNEGDGIIVNQVDLELGIASANLAKGGALGPKVVAIGIGNAVDNPTNLILISGTRASGPEQDFYTTGFDTLDDALLDIANNNCGGSLQLVKRIVNDDGGTATVSTFGITTSAPGALDFGAGVGRRPSTLAYSSAVLPVDAGPYTFSELDVAGYAEGTWSCTGATATGTAFDAGAVTVPNGGDVVCTITNDDQPGSLQLVKRIINDDGGTATVSTFGIITSAPGALNFGAGVADGRQHARLQQRRPPGRRRPYTFSELDVAGYTEGTWSCTGATATGTAFDAGAVTVPNGGDVVCTITNDDQQGSPRSPWPRRSTSAPVFAAGAWTVEYEVEVENTGAVDTTYDLQDSPTFGAGVTVTNIAVASSDTAVAVAIDSLAPPATTSSSPSLITVGRDGRLHHHRDLHRRRHGHRAIRLDCELVEGLRPARARSTRPPSAFDGQTIEDDACANRPRSPWPRRSRAPRSSPRVPGPSSTRSRSRTRVPWTRPMTSRTAPPSARA